MHIELTDKELVVKFPRTWLPFIYTAFISNAVEYMESVEEFERDPENQYSLELLREVGLGFSELAHKLEKEYPEIQAEVVKTLMLMDKVQPNVQKDKI